MHITITNTHANENEKKTTTGEERKKKNVSK
jgi:hypothetical protein